jgi:hypothetical protein
VKIGLIADEFTTTLLKYEPGVEVILIDPDFWRVQFFSNNIDILLVESAWLGVKGKWHRKIAKYDNMPVNITLKKITTYCRKKNITTVFWNKEDPVHFNRFVHNLDFFDICFTTEELLIDEYKKLFPHLKVIDTTSFFFQPRLHNPTKGKVISSLSKDIIFCGGLYESEFPERAERLFMALDAYSDKSLTVFDRFNKGNNSWLDYQGFNRKQTFDFIDSKMYYQSGFAHINVNTCDSSRTMYSRRMLELLACGSKVIDITKHKGKCVLSHLTLQASNTTELKMILDKPAPTSQFDFLEENYSVANFINKLSHYI